jgi:beta-lactamase regulating signal transducer with metallopeptidase domain
MTAFSVDAAVFAAFWITVKVSAILGVAAFVQYMLRRRASAATRHMVWTLAIVSVLLLPAASLVLPTWTIGIPTAPGRTRVMPVETHGDGQPAAAGPSDPLPVSLDSAPAVPQDAGFSWPIALVIAYVAGLIVALIRVVAQRSALRRSARNAILVQDAGWSRLLADCAPRLGVDCPVRLLRSREHGVPMTFGTRRPSIVIPEFADAWTDERRRAVLLHELAHVARRDCLTQTLAAAACLVYWFHPAVRWIAHRMRVERELACDDRVIAAGTRAREYAAHLLEIAYSVGRRHAPALAVSMARPQQLEGRLLAALDDGRNRSVPALRFRISSATIAAVLLVLLAAAAPAIVAAGGDGETLPVPAAAFAVQAPGRGQLRYLEPVERIDDVARGLLSAAKRIAQEGLPGTWEIRPTNTEGTVRLRLVEVNSSSESSVPLDRLEGLSAGQLTGDGGPVQFRLRRDAGTFTFEGVVKKGVGAGTFSFTPDPTFPTELEKRGFSRPSAREQYQMAKHDIGYAFVDELNTQGYAKPQTSELVRAGQHGVHLTYLREMGALGYRLGSLQPLIELRDHGVTPNYIRDLAAQGYKGLPAEQLRRARDHGVTPEYVGAMREAGYASLPIDELINARDHGVTAEFVRGLRDAGHKAVPLDQLIRVRDHGVDPEYVSGMRQLGHALSLDELVRARDHGVSAEYVSGMRQLGHTLSLDELVRARDHGVSTEFVREMAALGYSGLPMNTLVRLRDHGVTPAYARELKALGYDKLTPDDLIMLRDHGLTPERIRAANERAGSRLPIDVLKSLARGGGIP